MILEFTIENFRSIDDEQVLSFYAKGSQGGNLGNTVVLPNTPYRMLKSIGLYGANASGKTNVLRAFWTLRQVVNESCLLGEDDVIPWYEPCRFRKSDDDDATRFEIDLTIPIDEREIRFVYKVAYTGHEIVEESLSAYPRVRPAVLFSRKLGDTRETIVLGASLKGGERRIPFFKNQSYLSVAGRNAAAPLVLRRVYQYFRTHFTQIRLHDDDRQYPVLADMEACRLIRFVDVGVMDVERRVSEEADVKLSFPPDMPEPVRRLLTERFKSKYVFRHEMRAGEFVEIDLKEESDGTQRMFWLFPKVVNMLVYGGVFVIDEIECGMHPFMAETIVRLFNDPEANVGKAQLIFTTHNSNLMSQDLLRRDQIWFTEKKDGRTRCYSLDDFDKKIVTPTSPYVKWYLEGRFGAVPSINFSELVKFVVMFRKDWSDAQEER